MEYAEDLDSPAAAAPPSHDHLCESPPATAPPRCSRRSAPSSPPRSKTHTHAPPPIARHSGEISSPKLLQNPPREILDVAAESDPAPRARPPFLQQLARFPFGNIKMGPLRQSPFNRRHNLPSSIAPVGPPTRAGSQVLFVINRPV